jgi:hypothetical protein
MLEAMGMLESLNALIVLIDSRGATLLLVDMLHELAEVYIAFLARLTCTYYDYVVDIATTSCCFEAYLDASPFSMTISQNSDCLVVMSVV